MAEASRLEKRRARQRDAALKKAMASRLVRADLRAKCKSGEVDPLALVAGRLDEWEDQVTGWRLEQLLRMVPRLGPVASHEVIEAFVASPRMKVSALTFERREQLAQLIAEALGGS